MVSDQTLTTSELSDSPARPLPSVTRTTMHVSVLVTSLVLLAAIAVLSIGVGPGDLPMSRAWVLFWNPTDGHDSAVIHAIRVPRTVLGILAGAALAVAGTLMQALTRNPLADPGVFGVNAGASASIALGVATFGVTSFSGYVWFGFAGAALASAVTFLVGARSPAGASPVRLALAGMAVNAALTAFTDGFVYVDSASFAQYRSWVVGSLNVGDMGLVWGCLPFVIAGVLVALAVARPLDSLALGTETGAALGTRVQHVRLLSMGAITVLCGAITAVAGPIAFVGLVVPHLVRAFTGPSHRWLLLHCIVVSPLLLLAADVVGRLVGPAGELQVSIATALLGGPVFVLIARRKRVAEL